MRFRLELSRVKGVEKDQENRRKEDTKWLGTRLGNGRPGDAKG